MTEEKAKRPTKKPYTILVVEDETPDMTITIKQIKSHWPDCNVVPVTSLRDAYNAFKAQDFDMMLLDLNLPDAFGPRTVQEVRKFNRHTPIVVITGMATGITVDESFKMGANSVIPKSELTEEDFFNILDQNVNK